MATKPLAGKICIVTGASRGLGRGIALQLGEAGATVYITGRTLEAKPGDADQTSLKTTAEQVEARGGQCIPVQCDHTNDSDVEQLFERVKRERDGQLDILVNNAYAAVEVMKDYIGKQFWELPLFTWDAANNVGLRNHYRCAVFASRLMVPRRQGLIVNISSAGGLTKFFSPEYGIGKEACDRMAADCAEELKAHNVAFVSLWPGAVKTERVLQYTSNLTFEGVPDNEMVRQLKALDGNWESVEFSGKCIVHLACDPMLMKKSGRILNGGQLGQEYGFKDIDGSSPPSIFQLNYLLLLCGFKRLHSYIPNFIKVPGQLLWLAGYKF